ncbi:tetratricopeptide repeat protein [Penaeicola halotolerans]|uniref:tetratricopeptide repeat protein n=1 Tax=Penaeicola halotolerans TaxID=2793196 RepID=UPI001CF850EF|nr:tetratricopeptide repeat protein [Penaeicola halotolerans]
MATKQTKKGKTGAEFMENPDVIAQELSKGEDFLKKNSALVIGVFVLIFAVVGGIVGYNYYISNQNTKAQNEIFQAVYFFEEDAFDQALYGSLDPAEYNTAQLWETNREELFQTIEDLGAQKGFLQIIEEYSGTEAANLAHYYTGIIYMREGEFEKALDHLQSFSSDDYLVQARALSLIGDAHMELGNTSEAVKYYNRALDNNTNKYTSPRYLIKIAVAEEAAGNNAAAISAYDEIITKYSESAEFTTARKHKARLEGLASK